ncbi:MAG: hypothetical protein ACOC1D_05045 [Prolixibacteraceae bacterium]
MTQKQVKNGLLIVKFPYEIAFGGEEIIHLFLAKKLREKGYQTALLSSCPFSHDSFLKNGFYSKKFWFHKTDPVSIKSLLFFPFTAFFLFCNPLSFFKVFKQIAIHQKSLLFHCFYKS